MKILVISNLYPPNVFGGAEVLTHALVGELRKRHQVTVLTARGALAHEPDVLPLLHLSRRYPLPLNHNFVDLLRLACVSPGNYLTTRRVIRQWNPDVVLVSDLKRLGFGPLAAAQRPPSFTICTRSTSATNGRDGARLCVGPLGG